MHRTFACLALGLVVCLSSLSASARADVRSGSVQDPLDKQPTVPSLNPTPAVTEVTAAAVTYNQETGTVAASVSFNQRVDGERLRAGLSLNGPQACAAHPTTAAAAVPRLQLWLNSDPDVTPNATAELAGFAGAVVAATQVSADQRTISATFTHPAFAARDWRCVGGSNNEADSDEFAFPFAGYEPKELTPASATTALKAELTRRYGPGWEGPGSWTACPRVEIVEDGYTENAVGPQGLCEFRFRIGNRWRHGSVLVSEEQGDVVIASFSSATFAKPMRACRALRTLRAQGVFQRRLRAGGFVGCQDNSASMIRDLHRLKPGVRRVGFHGTNRAGFEDAVTFRCVLRARTGGRRTATCGNALGDRFVYRFRLA